MAEYTKHKYMGDDLKKLIVAFRKIANDNPLVNKKKPKKVYDLQNELVALDAECKIVLKMYKLNDFEASVYAYSFTMRKIEEIVEYVYQHFADKTVKQWANESQDFTSVRNKDGSLHNYTNLGYIYEYLYNQQEAIAARYFIEYNIQYLERGKSEKDYPSRAKILESAIWWINQGLLGRFGLKMPFTEKKYDWIPKTVIFSTFPSSGKSYLVNTTNEMFIELNYIINKMGGFLRVGNELGNITRQSTQTMNLINNIDILDIYPENREFVFKGKYCPFGKESAEEWGLNGCKYDPATSIFKTRDSAINSVRCVIASMDDPSRGVQEATNVKIHNDIVQLYRGDFSDRFKNYENRFVILTGTMFNPEDVFALESAEAMVGAYKDERFLNTWVNKEKGIVVILNDCEDEYGNSAFPEFISNEALAEKRKGLDPYLYACVWRQKPIPAEGLLFAKDNLSCYGKNDDAELDEYSFSYIDPTRKSARDFFAMPICKKNRKNDKHRLVDAIYEQSSSIDLYDKICDKIEQNKILKLVIENNVDVSLAEMIKDKLKERGIRYCEVLTKYNTVKKQERIANMQYSVKQYIEFPEPDVFPPRHPVNLFMRHLMQYSAESSTSGRIHDDGADAICGYTQCFVVDMDLKNTIKSSRKLPF